MESVNPENGNPQITVNNKMSSYFIECVSSYEIEVVEDLNYRIPYSELILQSSEETQELTINDPTKEELQSVQVPGGVSVIRIRMSDRSHYASYRLELLLESEATWTNFQLLERTDVEISGVEAELAEYLVDKFVPIQTNAEGNLWYCCVVYFDYDDLLWSIEVKCDLDVRDQVKNDFNHIVETFKILD